MAKTELNPNSFLFPFPVVIVGTVINGKNNFLAVACITRVNFNPPLICVTLTKTHYTTPELLKTKQFSVNLPSLKDLPNADYVGCYSGRDVDKSKIYTTFFHTLPHAPLIKECPLVMGCEVVQTIELDQDILVIAEVKFVFCEDAALVDGIPDLGRIQPILFSMPDNKYWSLGDYVADAWKISAKP